MKTKTCLWCGITRSVNIYHTDNRRPDKLQDICKTCNKFKTLYKLYNRKTREEIEGMIKEREERIQLMKMKLKGVKPREAVSSMTLSQM